VHVLAELERPEGNGVAGVIRAEGREHGRQPYLHLDVVQARCARQPV
jgi:hypothetical protein